MPRSFKLLFVLAAIALAAWGCFEMAIRQAPFPETLKSPLIATPVVLGRRDRPARSGNAVARDARPVPLHEMGIWLPWATVAIEDHRFWRHHGVDWGATLSAFLRDIRNLRIVSGASTITQQTVKIATGRKRQTIEAKTNEAFCALKLERLWDKKRILEAYLNRLDYGNRCIGAEAASQAYFGKDAANLTMPEAIFLAGLPQSPGRLNPWKNPQQAQARYQRNVEHLARIHALPKGITKASLLAAAPKVETHHPQVEFEPYVTTALTKAKAQPVLAPGLQRVAEPLRIGDAAIARTETLEILFPRDSSSFDFNPNLPKNQQMIRLKTSQPGCQWLANGKKSMNFCPFNRENGASLPSKMERLFNQNSLFPNPIPDTHH